MINRRRFLAIGTAAGASLLLRRFRRLPHAAAATPLDARRLKKFVDELPRPKRLREAALEIAAVEFEQQLHAELPPTRLWGYAGTYPGPTIEVTRGVPIRVTWRNQLMQASLLASLPVDRTLHWANPLGQPHSHERYEGPVPLVTHLHGGETQPESDGHPEAWFTPEFARKGPGWKKETYDYHNGHSAATLWYHDHALGITRLTVYAGLAGFYLVRDPHAEGALNLPAGDYEREILIQDRSFDASGYLLYPQAGQNPSIHPFWVPEFFGNTIVVNGKVWPYMNVEPRKYRLRLLNGSNARFYRLRFSDNRPFTQIGTDGGFLSVPVRVKSLLLAPAERADVIVDFSGLRPGATLQFTNNARAPFPGGDAPDPRTVGQVMQFRVVPLTAPDTSTIPQKLVEVPALPSPALTRTLSLIEEKGKNGPLAVLLDRKKWSDQVSETPQLGSTEVWEIVNLTEDTHPIHLHLVNFQILNRQTFRAEEFTKAPASRRQLSSYLRGPARAPEPNERGWKDTVRANPKEVTRLLVRFAPIGGGTFPFDATAAPGYPWHCHILEHEDNEMMRPYVVTA